MAQISKDNGVAVRTIYRHFKSKDELIGGLVTKTTGGIREKYRFSGKREKAFHKKRLEILWKKFHDLYGQNRMDVHVFISFRKASSLLFNM